MIAYFFYKLTHYFVIRVSLRNAYAVATFLSTIKYYFSPRDRRAVIYNLRKILPASEQKNIHRYAKEVFINFGKYLIEFFRLSLLKKEDFGKHIKVAGIEHIKNALQRGKGVIVLTAHTGNWELGGVFMSVLGYPMVAVALPHRHPKVNEFFNQQRQRLGVAVVPSVGVAVRKIYEGLKHNKLVALVGDRDFANAGRKMNFLGAQKVIPRGPAIISLRTGAAIVPGFVIRQPDDTYILEFSKPLDAASNEEELMAQCIAVIESKIRQYPTQWLLFREFDQE